MKTIQAHTLDSLDAYTVVEADAPRPGTGQVTLAVAACGIGYVDALVALGRYQVKPPLPHVPGQEVAGRITAVGPGDTTLQVGDRVLATVQGGFAELACAEAAATWRLPPHLDFAQAAGFRLNHLTALHALRDRARLATGERLLVFGAAGGVGLAAVQVGRALDTTPDGWRDRLKAACGGRGPDVVFDPVCGPLFEPAFRSLAWSGRHLVVGFVGGPIPALKANLALLKGAALVGVDVRQYALLEPARARADVEQLLQWAADGRLTSPVGRVFAFDAYAEALAFAASGQGLGKTVLRVADLG
jgi:NADPH:quinone reductase